MAADSAPVGLREICSRESSGSFRSKVKLARAARQESVTIFIWF